MPRKGKKSSGGADSEQDLSKAIAMAVRSGQTGLGSKTAIENAMIGKGKAFVVANNAPENVKLALKHYLKFYPKIKYIETDVNTMELGSMIGRPHSLAVLTVFEPGDSKILELTN